MYRVLVALIALVPAWAGRIDIASESLANLRTGAQLEITITAGVRPSRIEFQIFGPALEVAPVSLLEGSTLPYYSEYRFGAWLESSDGRLSVPVNRLLLTPGLASISGEERGVAVLNGFSDVPDRLFGEDPQSVLRIVNLGPAVQFGLGPGYTVRHAISARGLQGTAGLERSASVQGIVLSSPDTRSDKGTGRRAMPAEAPAETPEPAAALLAGTALCGLALFGTMLRNYRSLGRQRPIPGLRLLRQPRDRRGDGAIPRQPQ